MRAVTIRPFRPEDAAPAARLFYEAVHQGADAFYDAEQRNAWAAAIPDTAKWQARLAGQTSLMAERDHVLVGYMTLEAGGHIDLAFVAPDHMGTGVATALYTALESEARRLGLKDLTTEASHLAKRFFLRQGWREIRAQTVERNGVTLPNFRMAKTLD